MVMAGRTGFEPVIFSVTGRRVRPGYTNDPRRELHGTRGGDRTHDLGLMSPTLYLTELPWRVVAGITSVSCSAGYSSIHATPFSRKRVLASLRYSFSRVIFFKLRGADSNRQPQGYEPCELPIALPRGEYFEILPYFVNFIKRNKKMPAEQEKSAGH